MREVALTQGFINDTWRSHRKHHSGVSPAAKCRQNTRTAVSERRQRPLPPSSGGAAKGTMVCAAIRGRRGARRTFSCENPVTGDIRRLRAKCFSRARNKQLIFPLHPLTGTLLAQSKRSPKWLGGRGAPSSACGGVVRGVAGAKRDVRCLFPRKKR